MLKMICDETGMGFAAVARVTDNDWTACAVQDNIGFGLKPGGQLELQTTLCFESRASRTPIVIDDFALDVTYRDHHTPAIYNLRSYISVPIVTSSGSYFGNLCAIDPRPARVSEARVVRMFEVFATLIAMQIESEQRQWTTEAQLTSERETATLREQFIAVLGHDLRNPLSAVNATAEYLALRSDDTKLASAGMRLKRTVSRMSQLIDDVMDFARGRLGSGIAVSIEPIDDIDERLRAVVDELKTANPSREVVTDFSLSARVHCDAARIQQLLSNLLGNALTHGADNQAIVVRTVAEGTEAVISVSNRGESIPSHMLPKVFEPYWRPPPVPQGEGWDSGFTSANRLSKLTAERSKSALQHRRGPASLRDCRSEYEGEDVRRCAKQTAGGTLMVHQTKLGGILTSEEMQSLADVKTFARGRRIFTTARCRNPTTLREPEPWSRRGAIPHPYNLE
ncbi:GAF domain-containing sensor histidine kinase [Caballeronia grimmiae]